jgi:C_GCAxxG_C_C family probable redox protein
MNKARYYFENGYNCGEAIIMATNEEYNLNIPISHGGVFAGGLGIGSLCGGILGAAVVLGEVYGRKSLYERNSSKLKLLSFISNFKKKYNNLSCHELKHSGKSCSEIVEDSYEILKNELKFI